jgi:hypothetical protein
MNAPKILLTNLPDGQPLDEKSAKGLMNIMVKANVDLLIANKLTLGELRARMDAMPNPVRRHAELATFKELALRWQKGQAPWKYLEIFAPDEFPQVITR